MQISPLMFSDNEEVPPVASHSTTQKEQPSIVSVFCSSHLSESVAENMQLSKIALCDVTKDNNVFPNVTWVQQSINFSIKETVYIGGPKQRAKCGFIWRASEYFF